MKYVQIFLAFQQMIKHLKGLNVIQEDTYFNFYVLIYYLN